MLVQSVINHIAKQGGAPRDYFQPAKRGGWVFTPFHQFVSASEYARVIGHFEAVK